MRGHGTRSNRSTVRTLLGMFEPVKLLLAVAVVAQVSRDVRFPVQTGHFLVAAAVLGSVLWLVPLTVALLTHAAWQLLGGRRLRRYQQSVQTLLQKGEDWDNADFDDAFDEIEATMFRGVWLPTVIVVVLGIPVAIVLVPFCFWLSVELCHIVGVQLSYPGFWQSEGVAAAILLAAWAFGQVTNLVRRDMRTRRAAVANLYESAVVFLVLLLGTEVLGIAALTDNGRREQLISLALFALLLGFTRVQLVTTPWAVPNLVVGVLGQVAFTALKLWGLTYASTVLLVELGIAGFWSYVLLAAIVVAAAWPARFISADTRSNESERDTAVAHHVDHMTHQHPSGPYGPHF